jgi:transposase-like protein
MENTIDFYLSPTGNAKAAKRFLAKALNGLKAWEKPKVINTDKAPTYSIGISELKAEGRCPENAVHRQVKYFNEGRLVECPFGIGDSALTEAVAAFSKTRKLQTA